MLMGASVLLPVFLPWLDRCRVKSIRYRSWIYKIALFAFVISFIVLGYVGLQAPTPENALLARVFSAVYFAFFIFMPYYTKDEKTKPVPTRVTT
jgi:ubiquinol-cytochrome c reductase cytochrome b subunit